MEPLNFRFLRSAVLAALFGIATGLSATAEKPFDPRRDPAVDLEAAKVTAARTHKRIFLDVGGNWCGWCLVFDNTVREDAGLRKVLDENYVVVCTRIGTLSTKKGSSSATSHTHPAIPFSFFLTQKVSN